jgi:hypothetical protein
MAYDFSIQNKQDSLWLKFWYSLCVGLVFLLLHEASSNSKKTKPPIEEAMERKPYGLRIF